MFANLVLYVTRFLCETNSAGARFDPSSGRYGCATNHSGRYCAGCDAGFKNSAGVCVECVEAKVPGLLMTLLGYVGYGMSLG